MSAGLFQRLEAERAALVAEGNAIHVAAEAAGDFTDEQRDRDDQITARVAVIDGDLIRLRQSREADRTAPAIPAGEAGAPAAAPRPFRTLGQQLQAVFSAATKKHAAVNPGLTALNEWHEAQAAASGANELVGSDVLARGRTERQRRQVQPDRPDQPRRRLALRWRSRLLDRRGRRADGVAPEARPAGDQPAEAHRHVLRNR
jgi:hypothetical protein